MNSGPVCGALAAWLAIAAVSGAARAEDTMSPGDQRALSALAAAVVAAAPPLAIGGARQAEVGKDYPRKNSGWIVAGAGLALAPVASHLAVRSYDRAAIFGAVPAAATAGIAALVTVNPKALYDGDTGTRTLFAVLFTTAAVTSAVGVIDAIRPLWGDGEKTSRAALHLAPGRVSIEGAF